MVTWRKVTPVLLAVATALITLVWVFPIYWGLITSIKSLPEIMSATPTFYPRTFTLENYAAVLFGSKYVLYLRNSLSVASMVVALTLIIGATTAFALARLRFPGREWIGLLILFVYLFPGILLIVPLYQIMVRLGLYNTLVGIALTHILFTLPFSVWYLRVFFASIPAELDELAQIEGASRLHVLGRVYLPLSLPALAVVAIFAFVVSWNEYMFALILVADDSLYTLSVGIAAWVHHYTVDWGQLMSAAMLTIVPSLIFFGVLGGFFVRGLAEGAVKG